MAHPAGGNIRAGEARGGEVPAGVLADPGEDEVRGQQDLLDEFEGEKPGRSLSGLPAQVVAVVCAVISCVAVYWALRPFDAQIYRPTFLALALFCTFLLFRGRTRADRTPGAPERPSPADWALAALALLAVGYAAVTAEQLFRRAAAPEALDLVAGLVVILLVLEATRRTVGWILPAICVGFLLYAFFGGLLPDWSGIAHAGYGVPRIVGQSFQGFEGIFGVPLDVAATYIVLFTLYGAVLEYSGAARFFVELSQAAFKGSRSGPGRTTALAGFLLGTVSGSGVATTVTLGSVTWPLLRRGGYPREEAGGVLAASGIGAILSPPTLGAAAFIIAEFLEVNYLEVLIYALVPSLLYYLGILLAIEADARRFQVREVAVETPGFWKLLARFGYHFSSLLLIVVLLAVGFSPFRAVLCATLVAFAQSFLDRRDRMGPRRTFEAIVSGARGVLPIAATTAAAGLIVAAVSLTGLGLKLSSIIVDAAGESLALTALFAAIAMLVLGLAVPVTASFIIGAVVIAPALTALDVEDFVAYMFVFYYAVLSEVSPPTALSAFAGAAITGGDGVRTMMLTCRYTLPAFLVPFAFVLSPNGEGLLLQGDVGTILLAVGVAALAVAALGFALGGWLRGPASVPVRVLAGAASLLLLYLEPLWILVGLGALALALALHFVLRRGQAPPAPA